MNLSAILLRVKNRTDYEPVNTGYDSKLHEAVNDAYLELWGEHAWSFAEKVSTFEGRSDISDETVTAAIWPGSREVTFDGAVPRLLDDYSLHTHQAQGQVFRFEGADYTITKVASATTIWLDEPLWFDDDGVSAIQSQTDWSIRTVRYPVPGDCALVLDVGQSDTPISTVDPQTLKGLLRSNGLGKDTQEGSSCPSSYAVFPGRSIPPGMTIGVSAISDTPTATDAQGLTVANYYEFAWSFTYADTHGALSESIITSVAGSSGFNNIQLHPQDMNGDAVRTRANREDKLVNRVMPYEGLRKTLWFNANLNRTTGDRRGPPDWRVVTRYDRLNTATPYSTYSDDFPLTLDDDEWQFTVTQPQQMQSHNARPGRREQVDWIRPYPRINTPTKSAGTIAVVGTGTTENIPERAVSYLWIRYRFIPPPLALGTDVPLLPREMHARLVDRVVAKVKLELLGDEKGAGIALRLGKLSDEVIHRYTRNSRVIWGRTAIQNAGQGAVRVTRDEVLAYNDTLT